MVFSVIYFSIVFSPIIPSPYNRVFSPYPKDGMPDMSAMMGGGAPGGDEEEGDSDDDGLPDLDKPVEEVNADGAEVAA